MAKILLVDTNFSSGPIYQALIRLGNEVHVVGGNSNDYLAKICDKYWNLNYSDTDALSKLIKEQSFDVIIPGCNDRSYTSCIEVGAGRFKDLETLHNNELINNKAAFRALLNNFGLPSPRIQKGNFEELRWPLIVKPVDSFSGKGITVLKNPDPVALEEAKKHALSASTSNQYLIEEYISGMLHSHSAFIIDQKVVVDFVVREDCSINPFVVDTSYVISEPDVQIQNILRNAINHIASILNLKDGLIHTQFILDGKAIWLIEATRRCPGDLYSQLIELSTGFPYVENYVRSFLGLPLLLNQCRNSYHPILRHTVTVNSTQNFNYLHFNSPIFIERWIALSLSGDNLAPSPLSRVGIFFAKARSEKDLQLLYEATLNHNLYKVIN